jgi:8-oxo-dGTP pyrophosphatase MutT (NUDIX family)
MTSPEKQEKQPARPGSHPGELRRPHREISAGIIIYRRSPEGPKFLILYHGHGYWNFAKGKIESEERAFAAAFRETREETGLASHDLRLENNFKAYERFTFRRGGQLVFKVVIFYLAEAKSAAVKMSDEHEGYGWFAFRDAKRILGRYRDSQRVLQQAHDFLRHKTRLPAGRQGQTRTSPAGGRGTTRIIHEHASDGRGLTKK